jgi:hypothetical protein
MESRIVIRVNDSGAIFALINALDEQIFFLDSPLLVDKTVSPEVVFGDTDCTRSLEVAQFSKWHPTRSATHRVIKPG